MGDLHFFVSSFDTFNKAGLAPLYQPTADLIFVYTLHGEIREKVFWLQKQGSQYKVVATIDRNL
jgi:hypothetical protein